VEPDHVWDLSQGLPITSVAQYGTVDLVFASHLMEHIAPQQSFQLVADIFDILRPGGHFVAITPHPFSEQGIGNPLHLNHFTDMTWGFYIRSTYEASGTSGYGASQGYLVRPWELVNIIKVPYQEHSYIATWNPKELWLMEKTRLGVIKELHVILRKPGKPWR
jgi:SAM-dependent methyltransferase